VRDLVYEPTVDKTLKKREVEMTVEGMALAKRVAHVIGWQHNRLMKIGSQWEGRC
jgi:hypothetical protein